MFKLLQGIVKRGDVTTKYPFAPFPVSPNFRGKPEYNGASCIVCAACTIACPANALTMTTDVAAGTRTWMLNVGRCVFCARCEEVCPTGAIALSNKFELAVRNKADLMVTGEFTLTKCRSCEKPFAPAKEVDYVIALLVRRQRLEIRRPVRPDDHSLAIDGEAFGPEERRAAGDGRKPRRPIDRVAAVKSDVLALFADDHPVIR